MATRKFKLAGLQATLFAAGRRAGVELTLPIGALRRAAAPAATPAAPALQKTPAGSDLAQRVNAAAWYHTLDLGGGVVTPGFFDHRPILHRYNLPERLDGLRVLDVATFDGFWAFEFERRGAAEVVALDIRTIGEVDLPFRKAEAMGEAERAAPIGQGFAIAREALASRVHPLHCNVYDLAPERHGTFDLVHCGDLLLHLRDPARALRNLRLVTRGCALVSDCIYPDLDRHDDVPLVQYEGGRGDNIWWRFGATALRTMIEDAGFARVEEIARFRYGPRGQPATMWHVVYRATP